MDGDGCGTEAVSSLARVATRVCRLDVGHVQPRPGSLHAEPLPAHVDTFRVLGPRHERPRMAVDRTRDAYRRSALNDQRRRILRFDLRRLLSCTRYSHLMVKVKVTWTYIAPSHETSKVLCRHGSQFYLQIRPCLPLPRKRSPDDAIT